MYSGNLTTSGESLCSALSSGSGRNPGHTRDVRRLIYSIPYSAMSNSSTPAVVAIGVCTTFTSDLPSELALAYSQGCSFVCTPIWTSSSGAAVAADNSGGDEIPTRADTVLSSADWRTRVVGMVSDWVQCDINDASLAERSAAQVAQELSWACHMSLPAVLVPPAAACSVQLARVLRQHLEMHPYLHVREHAKWLGPGPAAQHRWLPPRSASSSTVLGTDARCAERSHHY